MIKERVITILKSSGIRLPELEERTGISRYTWNNLKNTARKREIKAEEIEKLISWPFHQRRKSSKGIMGQMRIRI